MLPLLTETEVKFLEYMKACYERLEACRPAAAREILSHFFSK